MSKIFVMRHAQTLTENLPLLPCRNYNEDLSTVGYNQAHDAGLWLQDRSIQTIISSQSEQTTRSSEIISKVLNVKPRFTHNLSNIDCGDLFDRPAEDAQESWQSTFDQWLMFDLEIEFPGGETLRAAVERVSKVLAHARKQQASLIVTHGELMRAVLPLLCVNNAALQRISIPNYAGFVVLEPFDAARYVCLAWDQIEHLQ